MAALVIPSIFSAVDKLSPVMRGMGSSVSTFATKAHGALNRVDRVVNHYTHILTEAQEELFSFLKAAAIAAAIVGTLEFGAEGVIEFDKAITHLQTTFGQTDKEFAPVRAAVASTAKETYQSAVEVADSFKIIGSKFPELKKNPDELSKISRAAIELKEAIGEELTPTTTGLVSVMSTFKLPADQAERAINVIAAASQHGAVKGNALSDALAGMGAAAQQHNVSLEQSAALIQTVDKATNHGAQGFSDIEKVLVRLQNVNGAYKSGQFNIVDALEAVRARLDRVHSAKRRDSIVTELFGKKNTIAARALLDNLGAFEETTKAITNTTAATEMAESNGKTFEEIWGKVKNAFVNSAIGANETVGGLHLVNAALTFLYKHMELVLDVVSFVIGAFLIWKTVMLGMAIVQGIIAAITWVTKAWEAAQIALNVAMDANPLGALILLVMALIAAVILVIKYWDDWGAAITLVFSYFMPWLAFAISLIQSLRRNWEGIVEAFKSKGLLAGLEAIGATIVDAILMPLQQLLSIVAKLSGFKWAADAAKGIEDVRKDMGVKVTTDEDAKAINTPEAVNPEKEKQDSLITRSEKLERQKIELLVKATPGTEVTEENGANRMMPSLGSTLSFGNNQGGQLSF